MIDYVIIYLVKFFITCRESLSETQLTRKSFRGADRPCPGLTSAGPNTTNGGACRGFEQVGEGGVRIVRKIGRPTAAVFYL